MAWAGWPGWWWLLAAALVARWRSGSGWRCRRTRSHPQRRRGGAAHGWSERLRATLSSAGPWLVALSFAVYSSQWLAVIGFLPSMYAQAGLAAQRWPAPPRPLPPQ